MKRSTMAVQGLLGLAVLGMSLAVARRRARRLDLRRRVALVTGGGRGLGLAIARELATRGCRLALCGRDADTLQRAEAELRGRGVEAFGKACDVSDPAQVKELIEIVLARYGTIDVLVNNAGQCFVGPAVQLAADDVHLALRNIFWANYYPTMEVLPHMRRLGFGRIANITSFGGKVPVPHQAAYAAGKYAATGWSQTLAVELAKEGIKVSTITPPPLRNGAPLHVHFQGRVDEEFRWFTRALTSRLVAASADRTARVVVDAIAHGDAERAVSALSWLAARAYGLMPNLLSRWLAWVDARLPAPGRTASPMQLGSEVEAASTDPRVHELAERARAAEARYLPSSSSSSPHRA